MRKLLLGLAWTGLAGPAWGAELTLDPYSTAIGDAQLDVNGAAGGAAFSARGGQNASGFAKLMPNLHRDYDSGLSLGLRATLTAADPLSFGRYGGDVFEKVYGEVRTGLGRLEIGQTDGAAYDLSVTGPKVDPDVSLDDPQTTFFRDPRTGRALTDLFALRTEVGASSNYAKIAYVSPTLFGVQIALSFTPSEGKQVVPFLHEGPQLPGRQATIWEGAVRYQTDLGPVSLTAYAGAAEGRGEHKLAGQEGVSDLGTGIRADYALNDEVSLSIGGAYRQSNAYGFDINRSEQAGTTRASHVSAAVTDGALTLGLEYGSADADAVGGAPHLGLTGYQATLGYALSQNIGASLGWQRLDYSRAAGTFYNGAPRLGLDAAFLHFDLHT